MKLFKVVIDPNDIETGCFTISLVDNPAVEKDFLKFEKEKPVSLKFDASKHIISGVAMLADTPIFRSNKKYGDHYIMFTKETIEVMMQKYAQMGLNNLVNLQHNDKAYVDGITVFESYIKNSERGIIPSEFNDVPDGSWIVSMKVNNVDVWDAIQNNELTGFSIEVSARYGESEEIKQSKMETETPETFDEFVNRLVNNL